MSEDIFNKFNFPKNTIENYNQIYKLYEEILTRSITK